MKKNTHPSYQKVLFVDSTSGYRFVCGSALKPDARETFEGVEYPVSHLSISSSSHPFFTGSKQLVDSEGRVEKFKKRFGASKASAHNNADLQNPQEPKHEKPKMAAAPAKPAAASAKPAAKPGQKPAAGKSAAAPAKADAKKPEAKKKK